MFISHRPLLRASAASTPTRCFRSTHSWLSGFAFAIACVGLLISGESRAQNLRSVPVIYTLPDLNTLLSAPSGLSTDPQGNLYVADTAHSKVWKIDVTLTVTLFAGNGTASYSGDNGPAIAASLNAPLAVASDIVGNVYIADSSSFAIRRIDYVTGIISMVAGGNGTGYTGDNGLATAGKLTNPSGVAVDAAGNIYISDAASAVVRRVSPAGIITTFAGGGSPATGNGDGAPATAAKLITPYGLALDAAGSLYIADQTAGRVRKVSAAGIITTFAGSTPGNSGQGGPATSAQLRAPRAIAIDASSNVYIADGNTGLVSIVDSAGTINVLSGLGPYGGVGDGEPASLVTLAVPYGIAVDPNGTVFIASNTQNAVYRIVQHPERFPLTRVGSTGPTQRLILQNFSASSITPSSITFTGDFAITSNLGVSAAPCTAKRRCQNRQQ